MTTMTQAKSSLIAPHGGTLINATDAVENSVENPGGNLRIAVGGREEENNRGSGNREEPG